MNHAAGRRTALAFLLVVIGTSLWGRETPAFGQSLPSPTPVGPSILAFPSSLALAPDGRIFFNEKDTGRIRIIQDGELLPRPFAELPVAPESERGLLGLALDPNFGEQPYVYAYFSDSTDDHNRIVRIRAEGNEAAGPPEELLTLLPFGNIYHNGGDITFGPDGALYVSTGEIHEQERAQDPDDLGGKVLRLNPDGSIPADNPFGPGNPAFSLGHRNSYGLCFDPENGALWETENGPSGHDEINHIEAGKNYGWPDQLGPGGAPQFVDPVLDYPKTIVPTGCAFWNGELYFGDFHGRLHRVTDPYGTNPADEIVAAFPSGITDLQVTRDRSLYVSTATSILGLPSGGQIAGPNGTPSPSASPLDRDPGGAKPPTDNGAPAAIVWGIIIFVVTVAGGLLFRRLQKTDAAKRSASGPPANPKT